ncbi:MAG: TetR/AcrR family transcriptional regulator [Actinomycetota bacterium]|nr:TetR/AcrR family transcriptional regulator [Actinomycetota bacterium]
MAREQKRAGRADTPLSAERIIEAALRISDAEGDIDRLTVRGIAADLGVGTMTLYSYFRSKDAILDGMADHVLGRMELPAEPDAGPADALRTVGRAFLALMRDHPSVLRLFATRVTSSRTALRGAMEAPLQRLVRAGIPGPQAARCYGFLLTYAIGFASYQAPRPWGRGHRATSSEELRQRTHFYAALPSDEFPLVVELAPEMAGLPSDEQFEAGLEAYVAATVGAMDRAGT